MLCRPDRTFPFTVSLLQLLPNAREVVHTDSKRKPRNWREKITLNAFLSNTLNSVFDLMRAIPLDR